MTPEISEQQLYEEAKKRVEAKKGVRIHATVYAAVNVLLFVVWKMTGVAFPWFVFPLAGGGIGLLFHYLAAFVFTKPSGHERKQILDEAARMRQEAG